MTTPPQCHCQAILASTARSAQAVEESSTLSTPFSGSNLIKSRSTSCDTSILVGENKTKRRQGSSSGDDPDISVKIQLCLLAAISVLSVSLLLAPAMSSLSKTFEAGALHPISWTSGAETRDETAKPKQISWTSRAETRNDTAKPKVVLISALFGATSVKPFLPFFLKSVENSDFDVLLFGDAELGVPLPPNVRHLHMSWEELQIRIIQGVPDCFQHNFLRQQLQNLPQYRKIIDYKPLFGMILQDEIREYDIWGHIDNDLVLGRLLDFFPLDVLASAEVIPYKKGERTTKAFIVSGPFTLFRNTERVNTLFRRAKFVCKMLQSSRPWGFDEWFGRNNTNMLSVILDAWHDPDFKLRLAPPHSGGARMYDGDDPRNKTQMLCEMQCPPSPPGSSSSAPPAQALDLPSFPWGPSEDQASEANRTTAVERAEQCAVFQRKCPTCEKTPVVFCHFQHWKPEINSFLSNQTRDETLRLLQAETLQINRNALVTR